MKLRRLATAVPVGIALACSSVPAAADDLGQGCTYQGRLTYADHALQGACDLRFTLWDAASGGLQIGPTQTFETLQVDNGLFDVVLDFGVDAFDGDARWLQIEARAPAGVGSYTTLTPRQPMTAAPYALYAAAAGNAQGTVGRIAKFSAPRRLANSVLHESGGMIGLGTTSPAATLEVVAASSPAVRATSPSLPDRFVEILYHGSVGPMLRGGSGYHRLTLDANAGADAGVIVLGRNGDLVGLGTIDPTARLEIVAVEEIAGKFTTTYGGPFTHAVHGEYVGTDLEDAIGVYGRSWPATDWGYGGWFEGGGYGLYATGGMGAAMLSGPTVVNSGIGVPLEVTRGPRTPNALPYARAIHGEYTGDEHDDVIGVYGRAWPDTGYGYGGRFEGGDYGIYAFGGTGAAFFGGDVVVDGMLTKAGGSFEIDHPLDPLNKTLSHSFVESPDMMNVYNGNATLDESGSAVVELPAYFEALNSDARYQLTPIGAAMPDLHVAHVVRDNAFAIAGGVPGAVVSWQVTGVRRDPWAKRHPIVVEQYKPRWLQGTYLHPEAYGQDPPEPDRRRPPRRHGEEGQP